MNTFTASVNSHTLSLNSYTSSLKAAIQPNGVDLNVSGNLFVGGNIVAQNYIVSSSVAYITTSFSSGSTKFGDDATDNHNFTGSVYVVGNISSSATIYAATYSGSIHANNNVVSGAAQLATLGFATTGSNTFNDNQIVNANETVNGQLKVSGSTTLTGSVGVDGQLKISGSTTLTGSTTIDLRGVPSGNFTVQNGATRIDSILFVSDNDYVASPYVGGDIRVADYLASGFTAHYDGGVQITGSLIVRAGQNGSGSQFSGSVSITGSERITENLQVQGDTSVSGNFIGTTISATSAVTASSLRVEGLTTINGEVDIDTTKITIGAGANADANETRINTTDLRVDSFSKFYGGIEATSSMTELLSLKIKNRNSDGILYMDDLGSGVEVADSANFTYDGVTFKVGNGDFEIDNATGNIRTSGSLFVSGGTTLNSTLNVSGAVAITGSLIVTGSTIISSSLRVGNTASLAHLFVTGSTILTSSLQVGTNAAISGTLRVSGAVAMSSSLFVGGNITASANANISGDVVITGSLSAVGPIIQLGNLPFVDRTIISGALELSGSYHTMTTDIKAARSPLPIETLTQAQAWSASFTTPSTASGAFLRTPDEFLEVFVGQGSNQRRYVMPVWIDETLYADDYFDISVLSGADSDYVF
jgi:cytoskeletal protein CcmA (bactofilin family)